MEFLDYVWMAIYFNVIIMIVAMALMIAWYVWKKKSNAKIAGIPICNDNICKVQ